MSERKTTEIKLRVTPAEKAAWQLAAEAEAIGLSELIRREMNTFAAIEQTGVDTFSKVDSVAKPWTFEGRKDA